MNATVGDETWRSARMVVGGRVGEIWDAVGRDAVEVNQWKPPQPLDKRRVGHVTAASAWLNLFRMPGSQPARLLINVLCY